jgi:TRAP-type mannitol/chloroaromatic compound transport system substrate-binding protein
MLMLRRLKITLGVILSSCFVSAFAVTITLQSAYPKHVPCLGTLPDQLASKVSVMTGGKIKIQVHEPDAIVKTLDLEKEVSHGTIDAAFSGLGYVEETHPAAELFTAVPFGPAPLEYAAWIYNGGGLQLLRSYFQKDNVVIIPGMLSPEEASGWYKKPINKPSDLKGKRIRVYGLARQVFQELGAKTVMLPGHQVYAALQANQIDGAEYSTPSIDRALKLHQVAHYYYFPGWHQPATFFYIYINKKVWNKLGAKGQAIISNACMSLVFSNYLRMESAQKEAINILREKTTIQTWSPEMLSAFHHAWQRVVIRNSKKDPNFRKIWNSLQRFRAKYEYWHHLNELLPGKI